MILKAKTTSIILTILTLFTFMIPKTVYAATDINVNSTIYTYGYLQEDGVRMREQPSTSSKIVDTLHINKKILFRKCKDNEDWYQVKDAENKKDGYIYKDYIDFGLSTIKIEPVATATPTPSPTPTTTDNSSYSVSNTSSNNSVSSSGTSSGSLNSYNGTVYGPGGRETYYNLDMSGIVKMMQNLGYNSQYWVRDDGVKMYGDYIMVAADLSKHPRGSIVQTSLGPGMVCDTGGFVYTTDVAYDIATTW